ncbi:MAG TPA: aldolase/citrate lyase family protein [Candidatus Eisenbacteria bacterium]|nr:aldolase/citrate lyase family protein [Candidatus Eisenbacteria bacterium]
MGVAGQAGPEVRSDLHVCIDIDHSDGIEIELESRVKPYYENSIRLQIKQLAETIGIRHARITIQDEGALPFTISARFEAAARRTGLGHGSRLLPDKVPLPPPSTRDRLRRSRLYIPGNQPKYFINAALHGADIVILDLEDSVHAREKDAARLLVRNALCAVDFLRCERAVRINQLPLGLHDLEEIVPESPDLILIPKVETPQQVLDVSRKAAAVKESFGLTRPIWLMPIIESALGIEKAYEIASASEEIAALTIGLEDYTRDLDVTKTEAGLESLFARQRVINAARAARVQAIDSVFGDLSDMEGLKTWAARSHALGFEGMGCVHPCQIPIIHEAFVPTALEIENAVRIVDAYREAQSKGLGVVSLGSKMIDAPVVQRASELVARAQAIGLLK